MTEVPELELFEVLKRLRDIRAWAARRRLDPWAFRQAMLIVLELDTAVALWSGRTPEELARFDGVARADAREWVRKRGVGPAGG